MLRRSRQSRSAVCRASQLMLEVLEQRCLMSSTPFGFTPSQIAAAYGINAIKFGSVTGDGSGQTIAIINAYDSPNLVSSGSASFSNSDLHKFDVQFGLADPPSFLKVNQTGGSSYPAQSPPGTDTTTSWAGEADLDVEWAHATAPKANIILVEANSASISDLIGNPATNAMGAVDYARHVSAVSVISMSFGVAEFNDGTTLGSETSYDQYFQTPSGHTGITFFAASGDAGQPGLYPAFSPNVVAVGDTSLTLNGSAYSSESGFAKSGGGVSQFEAKPSYQSGINLGSRRMIPDVAFDGDPNTGVAVYDSFDSAGPWIKLGGTSLSTPIWAGLMAITDQGHKLQSSGTFDGISQTLPKIYGLSASDFHDVSPSGYDLVTGRGTPIANKLVVDLSGYVAASSGGSISGLAFNDANGDGTQNSGEAGIAGRTVYNDANNDGAMDNGEISTVTDTNGNYSFTGLAAGSYKIRQVLPSGFKQTTPANGFGWTITLSSNQAQTAKNFGTESTSTGGGGGSTGGSISGVLFDDVNGNGVDNSEAGVSDWTVYNDANNNGVMDSTELRTATDSSGAYSLINLPAGNYKIRAVLLSGWKQTTPSNGFGYTLSLTANQVVTGKSFGVESTGTPPPPTGGSISGTVFNDANNNGKFDSGEAGLSSWTVYIDLDNSGVLKAADPKTTTTNGTYTLSDLNAGTYIVRAVRPSGWTQTTPANGFGQHVTVAANKAVTSVIFGEHS